MIPLRLTQVSNKPFRLILSNSKTNKTMSTPFFPITHFQLGQLLAYRCASVFFLHWAMIPSMWPLTYM